jgi:hypothetical protein
MTKSTDSTQKMLIYCIFKSASKFISIHRRRLIMLGPCSFWMMWSAIRILRRTLHDTISIQEKNNHKCSADNITKLCFVGA